MAQADQPFSTNAPDHLLLELCRRADVLGNEIDHIIANETDESYADEQTAPLYEELATIQTAIVNMRARTFAGTVAKAHCVVGTASVLVQHPAKVPPAARGRWAKVALAERSK